MAITAFYASLLAGLFVYLSLRVIRGRRDGKVALGDGGKDSLLRRIRVHGNFAEYAPMALVLIALAESLRTNDWIIHALGISLVAARALHAYGVSQPKENFRYRLAGMLATFAVLIASALVCFVGSLWHGTMF